MKTLSFNAKDGVMKLIPTDPDDLWVIYNIVGKIQFKLNGKLINNNCFIKTYPLTQIITVSLIGN